MEILCPYPRWKKINLAAMSFNGTFYEAVNHSALIGDWPTLVGNMTVLAVFAVTWLGLVLSVQRRFMNPQRSVPPGDL